jgi:MoaA/NifB/PqqE/SkfB family radical SAM enzyme
MLTDNVYASPRVKRQGLALRLLRSKTLFRTVILLSGLRSFWKKWANNEKRPAKFPKRRIKLIASIFLKDAPYKGKKRPAAWITKKEIIYAIEYMFEKSKNSDYFFGQELLIHLRNSASKKSFLDKGYFENFLIEFTQFGFKREFLKKRLFSITLDINAHCNLNCDHCFAASTKQVKEVIDYEILESAIMEAREELGCHFFNVLGGEPLLSIDRLTRLLSDFKYVPFQVFTNGTKIDENLIRHLEKHPNLFLLVSLEGNKKITDSIRGKGTYEAVQKAFGLLKDSKMMYGASITVTRNNYKYVSSPEFAEILKNFGCFYVWIFDYKPIGRTPENQLRLTNEEKLDFNERASYLNKNYPFIVINTEKDPELIGGCPATKGKILHIAANGDVVPCITIRSSCKELNISNHKLSEIIDSRIFQDYRNISCLRGCAQQLEPEKFQSWLKQHKLEPMYESSLKN